MSMNRNYFIDARIICFQEILLKYFDYINASIAINQVSISSTFYARFFANILLPKSLKVEL